MWIRSQNIKIDKFVIITNDGTDITLGTYSTKEKAIKVLDKIVDRIRDIHCGNCRRDIVFQMPQDNEVQDD